MRFPRRSALVALLLVGSGGCKLDDSLPAEDAAAVADAPIADADPSTPDADVFPLDPLAHYRFDDDLEDASGNDRHADSVFFSASFGTDRFGFGERALDLAENFGNDEEMMVHAPHLGFTIEFTIAAWLNVEFVNADALVAGQGDWFGLHLRSGNRLGFGAREAFNDVSPIAVDPEPLDLDEWVFAAGVVAFDGASSTITLYRDGELVAQETEGLAFNNPGACRFYVGGPDRNLDCSGTTGSSRTIGGLVDDVRVFDRALSAGEIEALYREGGFNP
jgi:hypothetical protein